MLDTRSINSGDESLNLQFNNLNLSDLSPEKIKLIKSILLDITSSKTKKEHEVEKLGGIPETSTLLLVDPVDVSIDPKEIFSLIESWNPNQLQAQKLDCFHKILSDGISIILNNSDLATSILENTETHDLIKAFVFPACKISIEARVTVADIACVVNSVFTIDPDVHSNPSNLYQIYLIKIVSAILYQFRTVEEDENLVKVLQDTEVHEYPIFEQFYVDALYRIKLDYWRAGNILSEHVEKYANTYFDNNPDAPLTLLKNTIVNPIQTYEEHDLETVTKDLSKFASMCFNTIEARWVVSALYRLLPLYKTDDLDLEYDSVIESVTRNFSSKILSKFPFLVYANLRSNLHLFSSTGKTSYLETYENAYIAKKGVLHWHQQIDLQVEYSSAIYMFLLNNDIDSLADTSFFRLMYTESEVPIQSVLFSNILVIDDKELSEFKGKKSKGFLLKWLLCYVKKIYTLYAQQRIRANPFLLFSYRATSKIPCLRQNIVTMVTNIIKKEDVSGFVMENRAYMMKILSLIQFVRISKAFKNERVYEWIDYALGSNQCSVLLNATPITFLLYQLKYYCGEEMQQQSTTLVDNFRKIVDIPDKPPQFYRASLECLSLVDREQDLEFISLLYSSMMNANRKVFQLSLRRDEDYNLNIPDETIYILEDFKMRGSVLALVGKEYLLIPEYWNLLATTVFNIKHPNKIQSFKIASMFYSVAKCFSREQKKNDQKFAFNYIRAQSLYYLNENVCPSEFFVRDTSFYINKRQNQYFSFKRICCHPFFELLKRFYNELPSEMLDLYNNQLIHKHLWIKKEFIDLKIGVFADKTNIK